MTEACTSEIIEQHGLSPEEYDRIVQFLGREPNLVELGLFSVMWSEHCSYKSSRFFLKNLPTRGKRVLQGPGENAGIIDIGEGLAVVFKIESHNHPSFIEPYQGAATGVGGILRDIFTMGARPIANLNSLHFGAVDHPRTPYLLERVVAGIGDYGNCIGVPTVGGEVHFDPCYNGNILVNAFCLGLVEHDKIFRAKAQGIGNPVIYVGSKTGRDGIHGATMASDAFEVGSKERRPQVQVGDPFTEKLLLEACLELMQEGKIVAIQDMGAAGLTSSSSEMASRGGVGIELDLSQVPRRETGMTPYEVLLSESQERMLLVAEKGREKEVSQVLQKWGLDVAVVGKVIERPVLRVCEGEEVVGEVPVVALTDEAPAYQRQRKAPAPRGKDIPISEIPTPKDLGRSLTQLIGSPVLASKHWVFEQYDHTVQTNTVVGPGADAAVLRLKGTKKGIALTVDSNRSYSYLDPYLGAMHIVAEGVRNLGCVGAEPIGITNCLNFGNPQRPEVMWEFEQSVLGMGEACRALGIPVVSGNVSFYNETSGKGIDPTPVIATVGLIEDLQAVPSSSFQKEGDRVAIFGRATQGFGGSEYLRLLHRQKVGKIPPMDLEEQKQLLQFCREVVRSGFAHSVHDVSKGGIAVALAECCFSNGIGVQIDRVETDLRPDLWLFGESPDIVIVSYKAGEERSLLSLAKNSKINVLASGTLGGDRYSMESWIDLPLSQLVEVWGKGFEEIF
ncbi:MAG: phosphoribosylformylglycinamidine synthase subunit PurL [Deltaproteobacteria bacterium]|nr:phosphoribosylformylglycinamidine synthase subunit PurL [Deltaproteobacteria bacterium]